MQTSLSPMVSWRNWVSLLVSIIRIKLVGFITSPHWLFFSFSDSSLDMATSGPELSDIDMASPRRLNCLTMKQSSRFLGSMLTTWCQWCSPPTWAARCTPASPQATPSTCMQPTPMLSCASSVAEIVEPSPPLEPTGASSIHLLTALQDTNQFLNILFIFQHFVVVSWIPLLLSCWPWSHITEKIFIFLNDLFLIGSSSFL